LLMADPLVRAAQVGQRPAEPILGHPPVRTIVEVLQRDFHGVVTVDPVVDYKVKGLP